METQGIWLCQGRRGFDQQSWAVNPPALDGPSSSPVSNWLATDLYMNIYEYI